MTTAVSSNEARPASFRFLRVVGAVNTWFVFVFAAFLLWILLLRWQGDRPDLSQYFFLFFIPLATGTGLISSGRRGELDLLFGAGETRSRVWLLALGYAWGLPLLMAVTIVSASGFRDSFAPLRLLAVLVFSGGVSFSIGLVELRYTAGIVWLLLRLMLFLWPQTFATVKLLETGTGVRNFWLLSLVVFEMPETLLDPHIPVVYLITCAVAGVLAFSFSYRWFKIADFGGKRS